MKIQILIGLLFLLATAVEAKKDMPVEKEDPPAATEIICFAAQDQWVCAPASDQEQAHQKAMQLLEAPKEEEVVPVGDAITLEAHQAAEAQVKQQTEETAETVSSPVTITTLPENEAIAAESEIETHNEAVTNTSVQDDAVSTPSAAPVKSSAGFSDWVQDTPNGWVLQLVGTTNLPNLEQFIAENRLQGMNFSIATTEVKGAPWHIVLLGVYDNRDEALAFKTSLPNQLQNAWPRPIASIKTWP